MRQIEVKITQSLFLFHNKNINETIYNKLLTPEKMENESDVQSLRTKYRTKWRKDRKEEDYFLQIVRETKEELNSTPTQSVEEFLESNGLDPIVKTQEYTRHHDFK